MILQFPKRRRAVCPVDELMAASRRAELRAEAIKPARVEIVAVSEGVAVPVRRDER